jgi:hypothetical protein
VSRIKDAIFGELNNHELLAILENQFDQVFQEEIKWRALEDTLTYNQEVKNEQNRTGLHQG